MPIGNYLLCTSVRIYNTGLSFLEKPLHVSQNNTCFHATYAKVVSCLLLVLVCLLVVNIYLLSLKINVRSCKMAAQPCNSCIALFNYIITICISTTSILTTGVLLKSGDIEINPGPKTLSAIKIYYWKLNGLPAHDVVNVPLIEAFITLYTLYACLKPF